MLFRPLCIAALLLAAPLARADGPDVGAIADAIDATNETDCPDCAPKPAPDRAGGIACAPADPLPAGEAFEAEWSALTKRLGIPSSEAATTAAARIRADLERLETKILPAFVACAKSGDKHACRDEGAAFLAHLNTIVADVRALRKTYCAVRPRPEEKLAVRFGLYSWLAAWSEVSRATFSQLSAIADLAGSGTQAASYLRTTLKLVSARTYDIKAGFDWLRVRGTGDSDERELAKRQVAAARPGADCLRAEIARAVKALRKSGRSRADVRKLSRELRALSTELARGTDVKRNDVLRKKRINALTVLGNLTWGLPNTAVGGVMALLSTIAHPLGSAEAKAVLPQGPLTLSPNGKQIRINSRLFRQGERTRDASLGLFELNTGSDGVRKGHEGGHAVQSALLGPFYFPAVGLDYLLHGHDDAAMEAWADRVGASTFPNRPEDLFGCSVDSDLK